LSDLFSQAQGKNTGGDSQAEKVNSASSKPLAYMIRPKKITEYFGQDDVLSRFSFLKEAQFPSLIIWGPPGTGKTTLAGILAEQADRELFTFNAVLGGVNDLKKVIERVKENEVYFGRKGIVFVDEIHRFNKAQQDALLPFVEKGEIQFIGATTENPKTSVNQALLSRVQTVKLNTLNEAAIEKIINRALTETDYELADECIRIIVENSDGDARAALNALEAVIMAKDSTPEQILARLSENNKRYDKNGNRHYDVISAFIKSLRGSDPNAALVYLAIMIDGGEDPVFIARRLVVFASEDIGNADPQALTLAVSGLQAVQNIGMPEARINLGHVTTYLASTVKSNAAYLAIDEALEYVRSQKTIEVPQLLRNHHPESKNYKYPHSYEGHFVKQNYTDKKIPQFYRPTSNGTEERIAQRLKGLWN